MSVEPFVATVKEVEIPPAGTELARCVWVIDLGTQIQKYKDKERPVRQGLIAWELPDALRSDGEPFMISKRYTMGLGKKALLRQHLQSWRGKEFTEEELKHGFDPKVLLGQCCQLGIVHNTNADRTYANVDSIMALNKRMGTLPKAHNDLLYFSFADDSTNEVFQKLPEWLQKIIMQSCEWQARIEQKPSGE